MDTTRRAGRKWLLILWFLILAATTAAAQTLTSAECLKCHNDPKLAKTVDGKSMSLAINPDRFGKSVHGQSSIGCTDCHADVKAFPHSPAPKPVECGTCHSDAQDAWANSNHAKAIKAGNNHAAHCTGCHGDAHAIVPSSDPASPTARSNIPKMCGSCHGQKFVMEKSGVSTQIVASYQASVHGRAVAGGSQKAAVCTDCHDHHAIFNAANPQSAIFKFNVPRLCSKCHAAIAAQYTDSVHGKAIAHGRWNAPVCTDCHGIHNIKAIKDPTSPVSAANVSGATCAQCHSGVRLAMEAGIPSNRAETYESSYHGMARQLGSKVAANCASCHGIHDIRPSNDPRSMVNKANLQKTCGKCHAGATARFTEGRIHLGEGERIDTQSMVVTWIRWIYIWVIVLVIGGMMLHNFIIWFRKAVIARRNPDRVIVRMDLNQRIQHLLMLSSFILLALTGFALKWPNTPFAWLFGSSESPRRIIHRIAAVVMLVLGVYHIFYMLGTKAGRKGIRAFLPGPKDVLDVFDVMRYYLGISKKEPKMGRFTYAEKAEYLALIWGTIVMGVTGLLIWYNVATTNWMPRWWIDVATTIHFYEAILATLAIIVWHLYAVLFDPDVYPMNWAWFDGKISKHFYEHEHGADTETLEKVVDETAE